MVCVAIAASLLVALPAAAAGPDIRLVASIGDEGDPCPGFYASDMVVLRGRLVLVGAMRGSTVLPAVCASDNASTWRLTKLHALAGTSVNRGVSDGRTVVVVGNRGERNVILSSSDAVTWRLTPIAAGDPPTDVAVGPAGFVVVGPNRDDGVTYMYASGDGDRWQRSSLPRPAGGKASASEVAALADGGFVAIGFAEGGEISCEGGFVLSCDAAWTSPNGRDWSGPVVLHDDVIAKGLSSGPPGAVIHGITTFFSRDGRSWTRAPGGGVFDGGWANGRFISWTLNLGGELEIAASSRDGIHWTQLDVSPATERGSPIWRRVLAWRGRTLVLAASYSSGELWQVGETLPGTDLAPQTRRTAAGESTPLALLVFGAAACAFAWRRRAATGYARREPELRSSDADGRRGARQAAVELGLT